jgi:flagellar biosynthesis/type III secretory pathway M-ring protein FliF/YscJ
MELAQIVAVVVVAAGLLLIARLVTPRLLAEPKPLATKPLQVRELGPGLPELRAEDVAAAQQAAAGANPSPFQDLASQLEANKAAAGQEPEREALHPQPPLAGRDAHRRQQVTRERLEAMARSNPRAVAGVLQRWISERR